MKGNVVLDIIMYLIIASLVTLIIMNASGFATAVSAVGGLVTGESKVLSGSGYNKG